MAGGRLEDFHNWHNATHPIAISEGAGPYFWSIRGLRFPVGEFGVVD